MISRTDWSGETPATVFFLYDGNCNVDAVVDEDGALVKQFTYDVFGAVRETLVGSGAETVGFSGGVGHITDLENSLVYMRARYYDPSIGRFISEDPGENGTNWYTYCDCDPVNHFDDSGEFKLDVGRLYEWGAYRFRLDAGGDLHVWWKKGTAAVYASGKYKHFSGKGIPKSFMRFLEENTDFFVKASDAGEELLGGIAAFGALTTLDAYARQDPVGFMEIMGDIYGFGEDW